MSQYGHLDCEIASASKAEMNQPPAYPGFTGEWNYISSIAPNTSSFFVVLVGWLVGVFLVGWGFWGFFGSERDCFLNGTNMML